MSLPAAFETDVAFIHMSLDFYYDKANKYLVLVSVTEAYNLCNFKHYLENAFVLHIREMSLCYWK